MILAVWCAPTLRLLAGGQFTDWNIYRATRYWLRCFRVHTLQQTEQTRGHYMLVRYEDFVTRPETTLRGISSFLGIDFAAEMLSSHQTASRYISKDSSGNMPALHALTQKPLDASRADAWKRILSPEHTRLIEQIAGRQMLTFGYEVAYGRQDRPSRMWATYLSGLWIASESRRIAYKQARPCYWAIQRVIESRQGTHLIGHKAPEAVSSQGPVPLNPQLPVRVKSAGLRPSDTQDHVRRSGT